MTRARAWTQISSSIDTEEEERTYRYATHSDDRNDRAFVFIFHRVFDSI